jgi:hypothetical protein
MTTMKTMMIYQIRPLPSRQEKIRHTWRNIESKQRVEQREKQRTQSKLRHKGDEWKRKDWGPGVVQRMEVKTGEN